MAEFVKKTALGYKAVQGGQSDYDCTHVILTKAEYENLCSDIRTAENKARKAEDDAEQRVKNIKAVANRDINDVKKEAALQAENVNRELAAANEEISYQRRLNENLLRINRERANSERKLKPKKEHTGYVVCSSSERDYTFRLNRKNHKIVLWETVLQSPYQIDFTEEQARKQITEELFEQDENGKFFISRIGVTASYAAGFASMVSDNEWADEYKKYNVMLERKLRMNFRVGYWEIAFYHTKPLNCVPKDMRMC